MRSVKQLWRASLSFAQQLEPVSHDSPSTQAVPLLAVWICSLQEAVET